MPTYKAKFGDQIIPITADSPEQAALMARLKFAGMQGVQQAEEGAMERSNAPDLTGNPTQILAKSRERTAEGLPGYATAGGLGLIGAAAAPGLALGLAKDAALYGAAEGAEKMLGLPSWTGEAIGAVSPARQAGKLGKLLLGGVFGGAKKAAATAAAETAAKEAAEQAAKIAAKEEAKRVAAEAAAKKATERAAMEAERVALRRKSLEIAERRLAMAEQKAAAKAAKVGSGAAPTPPATAPVAPPAAPSAAPGVPAPVQYPEGSQGLLYKAQELYSTPSGKRQVNEWLKTQPPEVVDEFKRLLAKGIRGNVTTYSKPGLAAIPKTSGPGYELAKMLGQVQ